MLAIAIAWSSAACAVPLRACVGHTLVSVYRQIDVAWDQAETACQQQLGLGASPQLRTPEELAAALALLEAAKVGAVAVIYKFRELVRPGTCHLVAELAPCVQAATCTQGRQVADDRRIDWHIERCRPERCILAIQYCMRHPSAAALGEAALLGG